MSDFFYSENFMEQLSARVELRGAVKASSRLKSRVYSALMRAEAASGALASLSKCRDAGRALCVWEKLVEIAPVGERAKSLNFCGVCHARVLGERFESPPIYWSGCPYVDFGKA
ncbi:MAG TPA: hypothetical protein VGW33_13485 [Terriglobia bacterium]|nr:hypothetical protein [Terriglobia bacterium]